MSDTDLIKKAESLTADECAKATFLYIKDNIIKSIKSDYHLITKDSVKDLVKNYIEDFIKIMRGLNLTKNYADYMEHLYGIADYGDEIVDHDLKGINKLVAENSESIKSKKNSDDIIAVIASIVKLIQEDKEKLNLYWEHLNYVYIHVIVYMVKAKI